MKLRIHRGTDQIGGSCVEVEARDGSRIIIDAGMPLAKPDGSDWPQGIMKLSCTELRAEGILPPVKGLFNDDVPSVRAVILSHAHMDHYGLIHTINPNIPIFGSSGTGKLLEISNLFLPNAPPPVKFHPIFETEEFRVSPFTIQLLPVDHSAPHAMAVLIRCDDQVIVYSGDLRGHGRKPVLFENLAKAGNNANALILEGTTIGQEKHEHGYTSEQAVEEALVRVLSENASFVTVVSSGQNLDRTITAYNAACSAGREMVIDAYQAYILHELKDCFPEAPQFDSPGVRVKFTRSQVESLSCVGKIDFVYRLAQASKVTRDQIAENPGRFIYLARGNDATARLLHSLERVSNTLIIWSLWRGYFLKRNAIASYCSRTGTQPLFIHSGGHANPDDLRRLVCRMSPKFVVPIHTQHPDEYTALFHMTRRLEDNECLDLDNFQAI
ncbi:MAG: MBL fold metallo-hydrolase [Rectinemataceae bacterium]|nr:MBL fold metallo-hydrolase [Rectinemataceae bacterium]